MYSLGWFLSSLDNEMPHFPGCGMHCIAIVGGRWKNDQLFGS